MDAISAERMHAAAAAGKAADAAIAAARTAAPAPLTKEERALFLEHNRTNLQFADSPNPPPLGAVNGPDQGFFRSSTAELPPGVEPGSFLAAVRGAHGQTRASQADIQPDDRIRIGGMETTLATALKTGHVQKDVKTGEYSYPSQSPEQVAAETAASEKVAAEASFAEVNVVTPELKGMFDHIDSITNDGQATENLTMSVISKVAQEGTAAGGKLLAERLRLDPKQEDGEGFVSQAISRGVESTVAALAKLGCPNGQAAIDFVASTYSAGEKARLASSILRGDRSGLARLAEVGAKLARAANAPK